MINNTFEFSGHTLDTEVCYTDAMRKKEFGQFFTRNVGDIFQGLERYVKGKHATDPFAGAQDLMNWARENGAKRVDGYDIDPAYTDTKTVKLNDTLLYPKEYGFVITNPPYLNINKATKETKERYFNGSDLEDLYQLSLVAISDSDEGIVVLPINFLSAENSIKIRKIFFEKFKIIRLNYFRQQVFSDTTYNVIVFYYRQWRPTENKDSITINAHIFPEGEIAKITLEKRFDWTIGGAMLGRIKEQRNVLGIRRLVENDLVSGSKEIKAAYNHVKDRTTFRVSASLYESVRQNLILLRAIDSGTPEGKIRLENIRDYGLDCLVSKESSRNMIYLMFETPPSEEEQLKIIQLFNQEIEKMRRDYLSLFLTNFRDNDRKRISFDFVYKFINYLYHARLVGTYSSQRPLLAGI